MKNKEQEAMESGGDYDQMLRTMFESCDTVGLGLLTPNDFDRLCKKLSMQEHSSLLSEVLFSERNKRKLLSYETFRDTLVLFLTGDPGFAERTAGSEKIVCEADIVAPTTRISDEEWNNNFNNNGFTEENTMNNRLHSSLTETSRFSSHDSDIIDLESRTGGGIDTCKENRTLTNNRTTPEHNRRQTKSTGSPAKYRRYGRTSKPDMDLLKSRKSNGDSERPVVLREVQVENTKVNGRQENGLPENSPWKAVEVSFVTGEPTTPIIMKEEQFVGEGNDDEWKRPDTDWETEEQNEDSSVKAAQSALESVWCRVVGNPVSHAMNESQLGLLCSELGMGSHLSTDEEISQLFAALDQDNDGLVTFTEFSNQMSVFLGCSDNETPTSEQQADTFELDNSKSEVFQESDQNLSRDCVFSNCDAIQEEDEETLHHDNIMTSSSSNGDDFMTSTPTMSRSTTPVRVMQTPETTEFKPAPQPCGRSDLGSNPNSPSESLTLSDESRTPESRGRLSLDNDTSPLCPPVVQVEPRQLAAINRGRRRRRSSAVAASNPAGIRHQRRKSSRSIPLPHYHPVSLRKLDELPLSYLTEDNERYVSLESLRQTWDQEGLENSTAVFEALQVPPSDESVSIEALSEVIDMELEQYIIQRAALILYKRGINHYRGLYEHERAERVKQESNIEHLMSQLQEQEERMEKVETRLENQNEDIESKFKSQIRTLTDDLSSAQATIKEFEADSVSKRNEKYDELAENFEKSQSLISDLKTENERLSKEKEEAEMRLNVAEDAMTKMREDLDAACRGMAMFSREHAAQQKQLADVLRMYETHAQSVQDNNDELLDRLQQSRKRWTPSRSRSPNARVTSSFKSASPLLRHSDTSSYSSASEESSSHHLSTCRLFVNESPSRAMSSSNFMTSSPSQSLQPNITEEASRKIITSDAFAFLTPSTVHAKSRVAPSDLQLMPPPRISTDC